MHPASSVVLGLLLVVAVWSLGLNLIHPPGAMGADRAATKQRIEAVAALLVEHPAAFGRPASDRAAWNALAKTRSSRRIVARAEKLLDDPIPESPDDLFLDFSRTGNRTRWQKVSANRRGRIKWLVLAECLENRRRFIPPLETLIDALCAERTWVMPAHDRTLANFKGTRTDIDLGSASLAWTLTTADYLLGDTLGATTRQLIRDNVDRRIFVPFRNMVNGKRRPNWWLATTNNWNAVCLAGVTGSALALVESRRARAVFVVAAETYSRNFLKGFSADGYCSEGVGYWNYGFGHYVLLSEAVRQATRGGVDLLSRQSARAPATYPERITIIGGVCPAFADCRVTARPSPRVVAFAQQAHGLGRRSNRRAPTALASGSLYEAMMYSFPDATPRRSVGSDAPATAGLRSWFDRAGVLIARPGANTACRMGVALKGGHNAEHHNHNDVGSYVVVVGKRPVLVDPGAEVYTARTFSARRYESKVLNSYGHPVPVVAGQLQRTGKRACARVARTQFTPQADTLVLDLRSAYSVRGLDKLERTFVYSREGAGSLCVIDDVVFATAKPFATALVTLGQWKQLGAGSLIVHDLEQAVRVDVQVSGSEFDIRADTIQEDVCARRRPTRIGIDLTKPVVKATIRLTITPTVR